jgi:hypothetical protein
LKGLPFLSKVEPPFTLETIQILNGHKNPMAHLRDDMRIDVEVDDWKSHPNSPLQMTWKRAEMTPFFEKLIVEMDLLFDLGKARLSPHLTEELSLIEFERFTLLKIDATLDRPNSKGEIWKSLPISIRYV